MSIATELLEPLPGQIAPLQQEASQRVILHSVSWATYECLLTDFVDSHAAHFAFGRGRLEIMLLSAKHEEPNRTLSLLVEIVAAELDIDIRNLGSTTFKRADLATGFEPDSCFYIQHEADISGKDEVDLTIDPPPDLVIEIDISSPSLNKFPIYAEMGVPVGVPEIWRYDGTQISILKLENGGYVEQGESEALPVLTSVMLSQFLEDSQRVKRTEWLRAVQAWARDRVTRKSES